MDEINKDVFKGDFPSADYGQALAEVKSCERELNQVKKGETK